MPEFTAGVDVSSQQMTRGLVDNDDPIFTLSGSVAWQMLSFAVDGIFDTTDWGETDGGYGDREWKYQELDLTPALCADLVRMTPSARHLSESDFAALEKRDPPEVRAGLRMLTFRKRA